jgi:transcriptional regulator with XRE-family HTH domain
MAAIDKAEWQAWMRSLGLQVRRVREFVGLSQEQVARTAGVSQGAVSRLEAGRGLGTPLLVILKVRLALTQALSALDPNLREDGLGRTLGFDSLVFRPGMPMASDSAPITTDPDLEEMVNLYRELPERRRQTLVAVVRAAAKSLADAIPEPDRAQSRQKA